MRNLLNGTGELEWQHGLRSAAVAATSSAPRRRWLAGLAAAATLVFALMLAVLPGGVGLSASLSEARDVLDQTRRLATGTLSADGVYPLAYPLWLLVLSRVTNDLALAARVLSGLSAVVALFLAYQLSHVLSDDERAEEQACFALLALALSPTFFLAAASGSTEMPHLVLLLGMLLCVQRALSGPTALPPMVLAGLLAGLSLLLRPVSVLVPLVVGLWLWTSRPFTSEDSRPNLLAAAGFSLGFLIGASPQYVLSVSQHVSTFSWSLAEGAMLLGRLQADPLGFLAASGRMLVQYVAADDFERFSSIGGAWQAGAWGSAVGAIIALAPTILKMLGLIGLLALCWLHSFQGVVDRARLPAIMVIVFALAGALALADERSLLPIGALLVVFAFAGLPSIVPNAASGVAGLAVIGLLVLNQLGAGNPARLAVEYRVSDQVAAALRADGATAGRVISSNWAFYDTRSPWKERYAHIPAYIDSVEALRQEMKRQGVTYLVFDREVGAEQWPRLASLLDTDRPLAGLRPLGPLLRTEGSPPNAVAIYTLE